MFNDKVLAVLEMFEYIIIYCNEYIPPHCHQAKRNNIKWLFYEYLQIDLNKIRIDRKLI